MKYLIEIFWSDDDAAWVAVVPDLPGCSAIGATPEEAAAEVQDATEA
jgi:antitoxin HicB